MNEARRVAKKALAARSTNYTQYLMLVLNLSSRSGMMPKDVERRIVELAG